MNEEYSYQQLKLLQLQILRTQRCLARFNMVLAFNECQEKLRLSSIDTEFSLVDQLENELDAEMIKLRTSQTPLDISQAFSRKCTDAVEKSGIQPNKPPSTES